MTKRLMILLAALALASPGHPESGFAALSATSTSQTLTLPKPSADMLVCNFGADEVYVRVFEENDTPGAATTAYATIPAGTATAPICKGYAKTATMGSYLKAISVVCDAAETATVHVEWN
jgi:hypothetical protein